MIRFLRGNVFRVGLGYAEIDVGGVGYRVWLTETHALGLEQHSEVLIYTYQHIREDAQLLFGFSTEEEREWFELMLSVSGIGPKGALQVISATSFRAFYTAVLEDDLNTLCGLPGIGKKTAGRLIVELKDKLKDYQYLIASSSATPVKVASPEANSAQEEVLLALELLGYPQRQVFDVVRAVFAENHQIPVEQALKRSLQELDRNRNLAGAKRS